MAKLLATPTKNAVQKTLAAQLLSTASVGDPITFDDVDGIPNLPGVLVIRRVNTNGAATPEFREYIEYSGTSGTTVLITTRNVDSSNAALTHPVGSIVEFVPDVVWADRIYDALSNVVSVTDLSVDTTKIVTPTGTQTLTNKTLTAPSMTSPSVTSGDVNLATGLNIQVNSADPKRAMYIPASAMYPSTTAPCASLSQVESSTNDVNIKVLNFDGAGTSKEYAEFGVQSPTYWDASTITVQFQWYAAAGSGTVNWEAQALALSDDDALDTAYGTLQEVTDTVTAVGDVHITSETSAITVAGSPVAGDWLQIKIARDPANDTNTSDAGLMGVRVRFGIKQYDDQ